MGRSSITIGSSRSFVLILALAAGCSSRPARFADRAPVSAIDDDASAPLPRERTIPEAFVIADAYVRRTLVSALDPARFPEPGDVNAVDEVPRSSWFGRSLALPALAPEPPLVASAAPTTAVENGLRVLDARGIAWELFVDPADRPEMRTAAAVIAGRLIRALGWIAPDAAVIALNVDDFAPTARDRATPLLRRALRESADLGAAGRKRVGAIRWPPGIDLGPTPVSGVREDDANDRVPHEDRRTLRALAPIVAWLGISELSPSNLRDVYVGAPGAGHVIHTLTGLDGALGADAVIREVDAERADSLDGAAVRRLYTLGLAQSARRPTQRRFPALGEIEPAVEPHDFQVTPPFEPFDRCSGADAYWAAKRMLALPPAVLDQAIAGGRITDPAAQRRLAAILEARRRAVAQIALAGVTPLEVVRVERRAVVLSDVAIAHGFARAGDTHYRVRLLSESGDDLRDVPDIPASSAELSVELPTAVSGRYAIVRVTAVRSGRESPRAFEAHFIAGPGGPRLVGIMH